MRRAPKRFLPNPYLAQEATALTPEAAWARVATILPELDECAANGAVPESTGRWQRDYTVYTGLAGICLTYLRVGEFRRRRAGGADADADKYITKARDVAATCLARDATSVQSAMFCGTPGYLAVMCVASHLLGDAASTSTALQSLLSWSRYATEQGGPDFGPDEMLFGRAGYLYSVLWVRSRLGPTAADFDIALRQVAERLVGSGRAQASGGWPLMWMCFGEPYLGAAHGLVGILAMLFKCWHVLADKLRAEVQATLVKLLSIRLPSGNMPIVLGDRNDHQVHWCHGAAGLPGLVAAATEACGDADGELRKVALQAGEVVWDRGVILKGNGLCHGLAGNGYTFLSLYRLTGDETHLKRANAFAALIGDPDVARATLQQPDSQRKCQGVPDAPRSLMEGSAGVACFFLDITSPATSAFPAWEL